MSIIREIPAPLFHRLALPPSRVEVRPLFPTYRDDELDDETFAPWFLAVALGRHERRDDENEAHDARL
jgi:hypothetical protein